MPKHQCRYCGDLFLTKKGLNQHIKDNHPRERRLELQTGTNPDMFDWFWL